VFEHSANFSDGRTFHRNNNRSFHYCTSFVLLLPNSERIIFPVFVFGNASTITYFFGRLYLGNVWRHNFLIVETTVGSDRKSTRLNSSHVSISYAVFCLKKKK